MNSSDESSLEDDSFLYNYNGAVTKLDLKLRNLPTLNVRELAKFYNLVELDVSENQLTTIPAKLKLPQLRVLVARNNKISDWSFLSSSQFPSLKELMIDGNPIENDAKFITINTVLLKMPQLLALDGIQLSAEFKQQFEELRIEIGRLTASFWQRQLEKCLDRKSVTTSEAMPLGFYDTPVAHLAHLAINCASPHGDSLPRPKHKKEKDCNRSPNSSTSGKRVRNKTPSFSYVELSKK